MGAAPADTGERSEHAERPTRGGASHSDGPARAPGPPKRGVPEGALRAQLKLHATLTLRRSRLGVKETAGWESLRHRLQSQKGPPPPCRGGWRTEGNAWLGEKKHRHPFLFEKTKNIICFPTTSDRKQRPTDTAAVGKGLRNPASPRLSSDGRAGRRKRRPDMHRCPQGPGARAQPPSCRLLPCSPRE